MQIYFSFKKKYTVVIILCLYGGVGPCFMWKLLIGSITLFCSKIFGVKTTFLCFFSSNAVMLKCANDTRIFACHGPAWFLYPVKNGGPIYSTCLFWVTFLNEALCLGWLQQSFQFSWLEQCNNSHVVTYFQTIFSFKTLLTLAYKKKRVKLFQFLTETTNYHT